MNMTMVDTAFDQVFNEPAKVHRDAWRSNRATFLRGSDFVNPQGTVDVTPANTDDPALVAEFRRVLNLPSRDEA